MSKSENNRLAPLAAGTALFGVLTASTLLSQCQEEVEENRAEKPALAPKKFTPVTAKKESPRSLGCTAGIEPLTTDPVQLQHEFTYKIAQCIEEKANAEGANVVCDTGKDKWSLRTDLSVNCTAFDDDGIPFKKYNTYVGPVCIDWGDDDVTPFLSNDSCKEESYTAYGSETIGGGYYGIFVAEQNHYKLSADVFADSNKLENLEQDLEWICSSSTEKIIAAPENSAEIIDMAYIALDAQEALMNAGIDVVVTPDKELLYKEGIASTEKHVPFEVNLNSGDQLNCTVVTADWLDETGISCNPKDKFIRMNEDGWPEYMTASRQRCGNIQNFLSLITESPETVEGLMNCEPEYYPAP